MENVQLFSLAFNSGLLVLAWILQLVVYPTFRVIEGSKLKEWHGTYVVRASIISLPIMFGQLATAMVDLFHHQGILEITIILLLVILWILTIFFALPAHQLVSDGEKNQEGIITLIRRQWSRTAIWTLVWLLDTGHLVWMQISAA